MHTTLSFTRFGTPGIDLGDVGWCVWAVLLILGTTNAVNLTDGLDGLAGGVVGPRLLGLHRHRLLGASATRSMYGVPHALDLAVVAACMLGACVGFLWWNAAPAQIFMGDTGSLAIGAGLAGLALMTNTQLLLPIVGGLFVVETLSVIIQVGQLPALRAPGVPHGARSTTTSSCGGWPETTVIIRFWILGRPVHRRRPRPLLRRLHRARRGARD